MQDLQRAHGLTVPVGCSHESKMTENDRSKSDATRKNHDDGQNAACVAVLDILRRDDAERRSQPESVTIQ